MRIHRSRLLPARTHATAAEICIACRMAAAEIRTYLIMPESSRLVSDRQHKADGKPRQVYAITGEGRWRAGIGDARQIE